MECEEKETISAAAMSTGDVEPCYVLYLSPEEVCARQCVDPVFLTDYDPQEVDITACTADEGQAVSVMPSGVQVVRPACLVSV